MELSTPISPANAQFENASPASPYSHLHSPKRIVLNPVFLKSLSKETCCTKAVSAKAPLGEIRLNSKAVFPAVAKKSGGSDGETEEDAVRPSRPRLAKSARSVSLARLAGSVEEDEHAELSDEQHHHHHHRHHRHHRPHERGVGEVCLDALPLAVLSRGPSSYLPGAPAVVSPRLSRSIAEALQGAVTVIRRSIGALKLECFSGANVVNCLMRLNFADNRDEATALAVQIYNDGVLRALQPGGFIDHVEYVYRFQDHVVQQIIVPDAAVEQPQPTKPPAKLQHDKVLFSISAILGTQHEDWLNSSFGTSNAPGALDVSASSLVEDDEETDDM